MTNRVNEREVGGGGNDRKDGSSGLGEAERGCGTYITLRSRVPPQFYLEFGHASFRTKLARRESFYLFGALVVWVSARRRSTRRDAARALRGTARSSVIAIQRRVLSIFVLLSLSLSLLFPPFSFFTEDLRAPERERDSLRATEARFPLPRPLEILTRPFPPEVIVCLPLVSHR